MSPFMPVCKFNRLRVAPELPASWERRRLTNPTNIATVVIDNSVLAPLVGINEHAAEHLG